MKTFQISFAAVLFFLFAFGSAPSHATNNTAVATAAFDNCPTASFSVSQDGMVARCFHFVNQSTGGQAYIWDFGDGQTSSAANPSHTYSSPGTYTVKLTVISDGCTVEFIGTEDLIIG